MVLPGHRSFVVVCLFLNLISLTCACSGWDPVSEGEMSFFSIQGCYQSNVRDKERKQKSERKKEWKENEREQKIELVSLKNVHKPGLGIPNCWLWNAGPDIETGTFRAELLTRTTFICMILICVIPAQIEITTCTGADTNLSEL